MIKFLADDEEGGMLVGLGLQPENLERLKEDEPILVDLKEMSPDLDARVVIFFVSDIDQMMQMMRERGFLTDSVTIHKVPDL